MDNKEPDFAFGKTLGISDCLYGNIPELCDMIKRLLWCMRECNKKNGCSSEFFRIDFRQPYFDESIRYPLGSLILDMKWGCKRERGTDDL